MYHSIMNLIIGIVGTYGVAIILSEYDGPFKLFYKARSSKLYELLSCGVCLSPYIAVAFALGLHMSFWEYLAVVGGSVIIARLV